MLARNVWTTISAADYQFAFERFGGSFALHPRVVALVASLAKRPVRYAGLIRKGDLVAAVPLWGEHIVASKLALTFYRDSDLIDVGDAEVVLPVAEDARISMPFRADLVSSLHADCISNIEREADFALMLAKGLRIGDRRQSSKSQLRQKAQTRHFQESGGKFRPISDFSADDVATIYVQLFEKRWGFFPLGKDRLPVVLRELKDMLCGDVLLMGDRSVAIQLVYRNDTSHWLFANVVNAGLDPEFRNYSPGSILFFRNIGCLEEEARATNKTLRFSFGRNDADYKGLWSFETPAYRLEPAQEKQFKLLSQDSLMSSLWRKIADARRS